MIIVMFIVIMCVATIMNSDWADSGEATTCAHALLNGGQTAGECHDDEDDHNDDDHDDDDHDDGKVARTGVRLLAALAMISLFIWQVRLLIKGCGNIVQIKQV